MGSANENSWPARIKPLLPPLFLHIYRLVRYGTDYRQSNLWTLDRLATDTRDVQFTLPLRELTELLPGINSVEVTAPVSELYRPRDMVVPLAELLTLAAICRHKRPSRIFEFGTHTGSSTLVMALNVPDQTEILTIDLEPSELVGSAYKSYVYGSKIRQLYGDSKTFDHTPYRNAVDLVFIDADHTYEGVKSDTEKAFEMLRSGGVIVWDDYRWLECHAEVVGVALYLNELQKKRPVFSLVGTRFAIYVDPGADKP